MFERMRESALRVIKNAHEEGRRLGHNYVGPEQLLLGLTGEGTGLAAEVLRQEGITLEAVRAQVESLVGWGTDSEVEEIPFTLEGKQVLFNCLQVSQSLHKEHIYSEHILLGLLMLKEGPAIQTLQNLGGDPQDLEAKVHVAILNHPISYPISADPVLDRLYTELWQAVEQSKTRWHTGACMRFNLPMSREKSERDWLTADLSLQESRAAEPLLVGLVCRDPLLKSAYRAKLHLFCALGAQVGLLVDPETETIEVTPAGEVTQILSGEQSLRLPSLLPHLEIPLQTLWA